MSGHERVIANPSGFIAPPTRMFGPLRPLRGSRFALRQPDACGAGEYPSPNTNFHESLQLALRYLATSSAFTIATPRSASLQWLRATIPLSRSPFYIFHFTFSIPHSPFPIPHSPCPIFHFLFSTSHSFLGGRRKPVGLDAARHTPRRTLSMSW